MEELEAHPALLEDLVQRREDDVPHARVHAPEERAAVREEHAHRAAHRDAGGQPGLRRVPVLEGEDEVVDPVHEARVERLLGRPVHGEPLAPVVLVDRVEAARVEREAVHRRATQDRQDDVDDLPDPSQLAVLLDHLPQLVARRVGHRLDQAHG